MSALPKWQVGNDTPAWKKSRATVYFIFLRRDDGETKYLEDRNGKLRQFRSREAATKVASKLNE